MVEHLNQFLESLKSKLPPICADKDLIEHLPNIFRNASNICRMRARGQTPPYFLIDPHVHYLRDDVIHWIRGRYQYTDGFIPVDLKNVSSPEDVCSTK